MLHTKIESSRATRIVHLLTGILTINSMYCPIILLIHR